MPSEPPVDLSDDLANDRSDDWARDLLHRAAATVVVRPAAPLVAAPRPRWPVVAAAAAVAVLVLGVALLGTRGGDSRVAPATDPSPPAPRAATVPSVFGLTRTEARARLEGAGLTVSDEHALTECEVDQQAVGTIPVIGEPVPTDGAVVLDYNETGRVTLDCAQAIPLRARAWDFLGWLDERRPAPAFATPVRITGVHAADVPGAGDDASLVASTLGGLRAAMSAPGATMLALDQPTAGCRSAVTSDGPPGSYLAIRIDTAPGTPGTCPPGVELHYTDGRIDEVAPTVGNVPTVPALPVPDQPAADGAAASAFLDFLAGRAAAPAFADEVAVQVDDGPPQDLPHDRAVDVLRWYGGADLRATVAARLDAPGAHVDVERVAGGRTPLYCGTVPPAGTSDRAALSLMLDSSLAPDGTGTYVDGVLPPSEASCRTTVDLYRDGAGAIDTVVVGTRPLTRTPSSTPSSD